MPPSGQKSNLPAHVFIVFIAAAASLFLLLWTFSYKPIDVPLKTRAVSILSLSQNRAVVRTIHEYIHPHGYIVTGILDSDPFSAKHLRIALRVLEPRPQVVLIGRGCSDDETSDVRRIFSGYLKEMGVEKGTVIKIPSEVLDKVGMEGVPKWVLEQLKDYFEE